MFFALESIQKIPRIEAASLGWCKEAQQKEDGGAHPHVLVDAPAAVVLASCRT